MVVPMQLATATRRTLVRVVGCVAACDAGDTVVMGPLLAARDSGGSPELREKVVTWLTRPLPPKEGWGDLDHPTPRRDGVRLPAGSTGAAVSGPRR
ncbi:hypothetical protein GCM10023094_41630 [Rhodococcus olei]|uniref:Uncharacterized protein n=1 Tax=Rhodococcus olei TaxID=2161675 RepID=A0ABP8PG09_9NOCA